MYCKTSLFCLKCLKFFYHLKYSVIPNTAVFNVVFYVLKRTEYVMKFWGQHLLVYDGRNWYSSFQVMPMCYCWDIGVLKKCHFVCNTPGGRSPVGYVIAAARSYERYPKSRLDMLFVFSNFYCLLWKMWFWRDSTLLRPTFLDSNERSIKITGWHSNLVSFFYMAGMPIFVIINL